MQARAGLKWEVDAKFRYYPCMKNTVEALFIDPIEAAVQARRPLRIQGGGSKDFYGEPFDAACPVLHTRAYEGIISYEPSELVITARAGTLLADLEAALAEKKQCLPFEPPHYSSGSTVGGMVAEGLAGQARACVGGVRDYVLGAHLINGRGQYLEFGGQVMKNVAGYDVSRALAGSLGTLGLIAQVSLKVLAQAQAQATLRFEMDEATAIAQCNAWAGQPLPLNASSWVCDLGAGTLYLRLRGAVAAVESACQRLKQEAGGERVDSAQTSADWRAARDLQLPWFKEGLARGDDLWRITVAQTTPPLGLGPTMIDWLGGQRWVWSPPEQRPAHAKRIREVVRKAGGFATLFIANHADFSRDTARFDAISAPLDGLHKRLKAQFDPAGIFNPGRLGVI